MEQHNRLLDIDVTLHSDVQFQAEPEKEFKKITQKTQGKVKTPVVPSEKAFENVPKAQFQDDSNLHGEIGINYSDSEIERNKQSWQDHIGR